MLLIHACIYAREEIKEGSILDSCQGERGDYSN